MPSTTEAKCVPVTTQTEKPIHYTYLKEFRVEQCPLFLQHKCTQHKPFTCFYWHFMNQRRRRPVRKRDGTFNYSPDVYCTKYDETTGLCPDGDDCPFLHRTAGDTERRYHLRYYKTGVCVYDTDTRGYCVKNGPHCAFAHGMHDLRNPVYDIRELQVLESGDEAGANGTIGPNSLDKERNAMNEDPKWQDTNYALAYYKTEPCKRPPRLCRQGYACPQFHNSRDRRRSPKKFKYRSTPCPNVKQSDEWGDPANCDNGDNCPYCHTRTEQQFHPEIYKSTKCNDIQQTGYCPRGPFCAFAHVDKEMSAIRDINLDTTTNLAAILSNALPTTSTASSNSIQTSSVSKVETSPTGGLLHLEHLMTQSHEPNSYQSQVGLDCGQFSVAGPVSRPRSYSTSTNHSGDSLMQYPKAPGSEREDKEASIRHQLQLIDNDSLLDPLEKSRRKQNVYVSHSLNQHMCLTPGSSLHGFSSSNYYPATDTVESVVGNALDDLSLDDINVEASIDKDLEAADSSSLSNSLPHTLSGSSLLGSSAPVTIPGSSSLHNSLGNLSPPLGSPLGSLSHSLGLAPGSAPHRNSIGSRTDLSMDKAVAAFYGHQNSFNNSSFGHFSPTMYDLPSNMSPGSRLSGAGGGQQGALSGIQERGAYNALSAPSTNMMEVQRLRDELAASRARMASWEEGMVQARSACEAWKREAENASRRERLAEQQRDEALAQINNLQMEMGGGNMSGGKATAAFLYGVGPVADLDALPLGQLKQLQGQLRNDLDKVDQAIKNHSSSKCVKGHERIQTERSEACKHHPVPCPVDPKTCSQCNRTSKQESDLPLGAT